MKNKDTKTKSKCAGCKCKNLDPKNKDDKLILDSQVKTDNNKYKSELEKYLLPDCSCEVQYKKRCLPKHSPLNQYIIPTDYEIYRDPSKHPDNKPKTADLFKQARAGSLKLKQKRYLCNGFSLCN